MNVDNVAVLRAVYCAMVVRNLEQQLDSSFPLPKEGSFYGPWGENFWVEIAFGVPGCSDFEYSAQLTVYVPTPMPGEIPGDVFVSCIAVGGEGVDVPTRITVNSDKVGSGRPVERSRDVREMACRVILEKIQDYARQARIDLQKDGRFVFV